jgi:hypothetical protein
MKMSERKEIKTSQSWLKAVKVGAKLKSESYGQMVVRGVIEDTENFVDRTVQLYLVDGKVRGRRNITAKLWWVFEYCELVED